MFFGWSLHHRDYGDKFNVSKYDAHMHADPRVRASSLRGAPSGIKLSLGSTSAYSEPAVGDDSPPPGSVDLLEPNDTMNMNATETSAATDGARDETIQEQEHDVITVKSLN